MTVDRQMLTEAGFRIGWFEDVVEGDTIMFEYPGTHAMVEATVTDLRPSSLAPGARRFIATRTSGEQSLEKLGAEYPLWILRREEVDPMP